jgi:hypothetical protein
MKKLLIGLLTLTSLSSFAGFLGTPDEDPVVANLRLRFEKGIEPKAEYLLQHVFKCKEMIARRGQFDKKSYRSDLRFEEFDGFLTAVQENTRMDNILYTFNGTELIGSDKSSSGEVVVYDAYRVDSKGFLISEFSAVSRSTSAELSPISFSKGKVQSYTLCVPK